MTAGEIVNESGILIVDIERIYQFIIGEMITIRDEVVKINDLDYEDVLEFSADLSTLPIRYVAALSIIANFANDIDPTLVPDDEKVDLSICKMIMDGVIEIEDIGNSVH